MKIFFISCWIGFASLLPLRSAQPAVDYSHVDAYITPFYNGEGPVVHVGPFSDGLASKDEKEFLATVSKMRKKWDRLTFPELYVAAIRLYDLGYRKESVYWFYTAQYRGRQFGILLDHGKMGGIGSDGFELLQAQNAFYQLVGPYINGYAFGDLASLADIIKRVKNEASRIPDLEAVYPGVAFRAKADWKSENTQLAEGMGKLLTMLAEQKEAIHHQRIKEGVEESFAKLKSKDLPAGS